MTEILDHIVINARFEMDRAEEIFTSLGFTLTPRGRHSMGSINHLAMFAGDYLELVGIPQKDAHMRPEIGEAPPGLYGLVFKSEDVDATFSRLEALSMDGDPPNSFSRPVTLNDGSTGEAAFRTVTARAGAFPAGRLYFCEHLTPELVWRSEWLTHANGATGFSELIIVTPHPREEASSLGALVENGADPAEHDGWKISLRCGFRLTFQTYMEYGARFGELAREAAGREAFLGALGFNGVPAGKVRKFIGDNSALRMSRNGSGVDVAIDALDTVVFFD